MRSLGAVFLRALFLSVAVAVPAVSVGAEGDVEVLWWMVGDPSDPTSLGNVPITTFHEGIKTAEEMGITDARVRVVGTDDYLDMPYADAAGNYPQPAVGVPIEFYAIVDDAYKSEAYSFAIELGNYDYQTGTWTMIAQSDAASYTQLKDASHYSIGTWDTITASMAQPWAPTAYTVPEPTGGLLFIVGGALLALRRRRRVL